MKKNILYMFLSGFILGILSKLFDIYFTNLGNIFSGIMIWILFGILISIHSKDKKSASLNVFIFCISMLLSYYLTLFFIKGIYSKTYIIGWTLFSFLSPLFAYFTWMTKEKGIKSLIISLGIILVSISSTIVLFDRLRYYDFIMIALMIYYLFFKKVERKL